MKKLFSTIIAAAAFLFTACSPEDVTHPDQNGLPNLSGIDAVITVDQDINQVTFALPGDAKAVMPVWSFMDADGKENTYSTVNGLKKIYTKAGDQKVRMRLMNRNGVSDEYKDYTFHIDNTIVDFSKYTTLLCGGTENSSKEWRIDNAVAGHLGCGPSGTTGTEWYAAAPDEKKDFGLYDNRIIFAADMSYTFNPGEAGTMYVNTGCTSGDFDQSLNNGSDFCQPVKETTATFSFDVVGDDLYLVLPAKTPFPYIPNDAFWANPRYKVESITGAALNLIADEGNIAWHFTLTSKAGAVTFNGFKYNAESNLWKPVDDNSDFTTHFWYAPGWNQIADPGFAHNGAEYTFTLPEATTDQWQAQCPIKPNSLHLTTDKKYDFSCIINSSNDIKGVTVKLTDINTGDNFVFVERVDVKAYEDYVFYLSDVNNLSADADCELFFDFGGNPANTTVTVKNIVVKDHAVDDGTVLPSQEEEETPTVAWREADNLLANMPIDISKYYSHGDAWEGYPDYESAVENGVHTLVLPGESNNQWQCQYTLNNTGISLSADKKYDFRVVINSSADFEGATIKLTQQDDDNVFLTADRHHLTFDDNVFEFVALEGKDVANLKIVFDFGGNPANTEIKISKMLLQEHQAGADELAWDANAADNLWGADLYPNSFYYAPGWNQIANPVITTNGRSYGISLPSATSDRWQAQVTTETTISTSADASYDFQVLLTPNCDMKGVTVKLTKVGDDGVFYTEDRHDLTAYETNAVRFVGMAGLDIDNIKLVLDFGGNPDGAEVEVSDIILRKH